MIILNDIGLKYNKHVIFDHASFKIHDTGLTLIKGPSGIGKSSLLKIITNKVKYQGTCSIDGYTYQNNDMIIDQKVFAFIDNEFFLMNKTLSENLSYFISLDGYKKAKLNRLLEEFELKSNIDLKMKFLSKGQQDLVKIIIVLLNDAKYVFLDEVIASLDTSNRIKVFEELKKLSQEKSVILVSHDSVTIEHADYVILLPEHKEIIKENIKSEDKKVEEKLKYKNNNIVFLFLNIILMIISFAMPFFIFGHKYYNDTSINLNNNEMYLMNEDDTTSKSLSKQDLMRFFDECSSLKSFKLSNDSSSFIINDYLNISGVPNNKLQQSSYFINNYSSYSSLLDENEVMVSNNLYTYIKECAEMKGYDLSKCDVAFRYYSKNFKIVGTFESPYYEIYINSSLNYILMNQNIYYNYSPRFTFGKPENVNEEKTFYLSKDNYEQYYDSLLSIASSNALNIEDVSFIDESIIYINTDNLNIDPLDYYILPYENINITLLQGNYPKNNNEVVVPFIFKNNENYINSIINRELKIVGYYSSNIKLLSSHAIYGNMHTYIDNTFNQDDSINCIFQYDDINKVNSYFNQINLKVITRNSIKQTSYNYSLIIISIVAPIIISIFSLIVFSVFTYIKSSNDIICALNSSSSLTKMKKYFLNRYQNDFLIFNLLLTSTTYVFYILSSIIYNNFYVNIYISIIIFIILLISQALIFITYKLINNKIIDRLYHRY